VYLDELLDRSIYTFMVEFKNWLLNEDGFAGDGGNSWDLLYPTYADDYPYASQVPLDHFWLQWRWERGEQLGRILHNIDNDEFQRRGYVSVSSPDMPDAGDGFWVHKEDNNKKGSNKPVYSQDLRWIVQGKTSKDVGVTDHPELKKHWSKLGPTGYAPDANLDKIFKDGDRHTHTWPDIDEKYMDTDWVLPQHRSKKQIKESTMNFKQWLENGGAATSAMHGGLYGLPYKTTNDNMPVRSKYTTADGIAKFGDDTRPRSDKNGNPSTVDTEWLGKKRTPLTKRPGERKSMWIDKNRRSVPTRDDRPDIVY